MPPFVYKEFFVSITVNIDSAFLRTYTPIVQISRAVNDEYPLVTIVTGHSYKTEEEAYVGGVERAKSWIDDHPLG